MPDSIRIRDFAQPELPDWFEELHETMGIGPEQRLDPMELLTEAIVREGGYDDYGDDQWFVAPFKALVASVEADGELSPMGRFQVRELLVGLLVTRLRLTRLLERHPEILELPVDAPVVVLGLPRTGTTHLHDLLSADPRFRYLPYWESLEPIAPGDGRPPAERPDPRVERTDLALTMLNTAMPLFPAMHEMTTDGAHEEIQLLAVDFATMLFEASYDVAGYADWYRRTDQTHAYRTLKVLLQVLQFLRPAGERWLLKSPQHLEQLGPLLSVFPDARIVQTHRDPVAVTASMTTMAAYSRRTNYLRIDPQRIGATWAERIEAMLLANLRDRPLVPDDQVMDVSFDEYMADQWAVLADVYDLAGMDLSDDVRGRLQAAMDARPRGRHGRVEYHLDDFGIDAAERRAALAPYQERFAVPDEPID
ncbi:MAG: sulfotransferase [Acidimicrobiia bacterium]|nr:sulfotransferase [Acidimicrobiia bacterium]